MKNIFIINPNSGRKTHEKLIADIKEACEKENAEYEIYHTTCNRDAEEFVRKRACGGDELRFFACGGDGTLGEVANGAFGRDNVSVGVIPLGTGNDFIRNFSPMSAFSDIRALIRGTVQRFDLIRYNSRFAVNTINIGFDCSVVDRVEKMRNVPLVTGSKAYTICALLELVPMPKCLLKLIHDGKEEIQKLTLCSIGNGRYCGGGYKSNPKAILDDGKLDVFRAHENVGRVGFLQMLGGYREGTLLDNPKKSRYMSYFQSEELKIESVDGNEIMFCADGEVEHAKEILLSVYRRAMNFIVPEGARLVSL